MFKKFKTFVANKAEKLENAVAPMLVAGAALGVIPTVYANPPATDPAKTAILAVIEVVYKIFTYIGIVLALWGCGSLVMAFKNEDADSKSRAIMCLIVGISLVSLRFLFGDIIINLLG